METTVSVLNWPARSPDLHPIENLWGLLVRSVTKDFRQSDSLEELKEAIETAWDNIDASLLKKISSSLTKCCVEVIKKKGWLAKY